MRSVIPFIAIAAVAGCTAAPPPPPPLAALTTQQQAELNRLIGDKVAGTPQSCLPSYRAEDMRAINDRTIVFRDSPGRAWVMHPQDECNLISGPGPYALVTRTPTTQLCRGEIAQVVDTVSGATVGSCVIGDFIPYVRPGA